MFPARFEYLAPTSWDEAIALLSEHGPEAKVLAGGCSLIPLLKLRLAEPHFLIDLRLVGARDVTLDGDELRIGAMTRESTIEYAPIVAAHCPVLAETSAVIADPIVRNMGTVGGNLAHADPANDHPATMLALGAQVVVRGRDGERTLPVEDFFIDLFQTALAPDELVTEILIPTPPPGTGAAYVKFERQVGDFPIVGVAAQVSVADGIIQSARIGLTNVGPTAIRAKAAERSLIGAPASAESAAAAAEATRDGVEPWGELRGSARYKLDILPVIARRALVRAFARASTGGVIPGDGA
jgi:carbon-monoxide dehydrogenase medium subunit